MASAGRGCLAAVALIAGWTSLAQTVPIYAGRPFVRIARSNANDPAAGFISGFGRAQVVGDSVVLVTLSGVNASGVFRGRGGPLTTVAAPGTVSPAGNLQFFHDGLASGTTAGSELVIAAGTLRADALLRTDGTNVTVLLAGGSLLPDSGGKPANVLGEPNAVGDSLAVIAAHRPSGGTDDFRGVYRVKSGTLEKVADTATALPGLGVPDAFSSQVGFDGQAVAFWAAQGPFTANEGMFVQTGSEPVKLIARNGDAFPDGGTMDGFISPPFVADGIVYFFAYDTANVTRLLKFESGTLTVLAKDGGLTAEADALQSLGQFGLAVEGGSVFFPARTARGPGLYRLAGGPLQTIIPPGVNNLGGLLPVALVLQDVAGDTVVLEVADANNNRRLVANLAQPAVPVIVASPTNTSVAPGARVELRVTALGDAPLAYAWQWFSPTGLVVRSTADTLLLDPVSAGDAGFYSVRVTNALGTATSASFFLNVEAPPQIKADPVNTILEAGDRLELFVTAVGGQPLSYFWTKNNAPATSDSPVAAIFFRTASSPADSGRYRVTVSNAWGQVASAEAVVTVNPAAPNPVFNGGRFAAVLTPTTPVPGTETPFDPSPVSESAFRVVNGQLLFAGGPAGSPRAGIFAWAGGTLTRLLGAGVVLPNGLGEAEGFTLLDAAPGEPLAVVGYQLINGLARPVGLYRVNGGVLEVIADTSMTAPGFLGSKFPNLFYGAVQAGGQIVFGTKIGTQSVLYRTTPAGLTRIASSKQDLPVVGSAAIQFQSLGFDGDTVSFVAATAGLQQQVALRVNAAGEITRLVARDDAIPGTTDTVRSFGAVTAVGGAVYLTVFNSGFARLVLEWREGELRRIAGPGMAVQGGGTVQNIESSFLSVAGGRVFLAGSLNLPEGSRKAVFAAGAAGIEPVLVATKLDARPVTTLFVAGAGGDRVVIGARDRAGASAFYANVGPVDDGPLALLHSRPAPGTLRLTVPVGTVLEAAEVLGGAWESVTGTGEVDFGTDGEGRFFRLRRH